MEKILKVRILGSGTSTGVPVIGCDCRVCKSDCPYNKRMRSSILLTTPGSQNIVIDTTPDFRMQMLQAEVKELSDVIYTHAHADHCHGFDDLRPFFFSYNKQRGVRCWASPKHQLDIRNRFSYAFEDTGYQGTKPHVELKTFEKSPFRVQDIDVEPVYLPHGHETTVAFRFGNFAYATDFKQFPQEAIDKWQGKIHTMVASGIRFRVHPTHSSIPETIALMQKLGVKKGFITHLTHDIDHLEDSKKLPENIALAYDGLVIDVNWEQV